MADTGNLALRAADIPESAPALAERRLPRDSEFEELCAIISDRCARNSALDQALCRFIGLLPDLQRSGNPWLLREGKIVASYLSRENVDPHTARQLVNDLTFRLGIPKEAPAVHVMGGLFSFLLLLAAVTVFISWWWESSDWQSRPTPGGFWIFNVSPWLVIAVGAAGGVGSMISMFARLDSFSALAGTDKRILWMIGAFKPVMGVAFALFAFAALQANLLPLKFDDSPSAHFTYVTLAFLAGFSERMSRILATMVEGRLVGPEGDAPRRPAEPGGKSLTKASLRRPPASQAQS
jgi:hypothetical protein